MDPTEPENPSPLDPRATRVVAKSLFQHLREQGLRESDLLTVTTELLGLC